MVLLNCCVISMLGHPDHTPSIHRITAMTASLSLFSTTRSPLSRSDFEPRVTAAAGAGDLKAVIFFPRPSLCLPGFYLFPSLTLKRTLNYSFGEALCVVLGKVCV